jgi:hypothetical protein
MSTILHKDLPMATSTNFADRDVLVNFEYLIEDVVNGVMGKRRHQDALSIGDQEFYQVGQYQCFPVPGGPLIKYSMSDAYAWATASIWRSFRSVSANS